MKNIYKRTNVKLVTSENALLKLSTKPTFETCKRLNDNLVAVHKFKKILLMNGPIYVGMRILDLSKVLMYDFHFISRETITQKLNYYLSIPTV